jgi:c-di-GMP phosphodiesterase
MNEYLIGRQPIFNRNLDVVAYELLYRSGSNNRADVTNGDEATKQVIVNAFSNEGLDALVGKEKEKKAYINATRNTLMDLKATPKLLPKDRVVIEVLEDIEIDQSIIDALKSLKKEGYSLALDDVVDVRKVGRLLDLASIIKFDLMGFVRQDEDDLYRMMHNFIFSLQGYSLFLLAEKVETQAEYDMCRSFGFHLFQGYFLCKPTIVKGRKLDASRMVALRSISHLQDPNYDPKKMETIISQDVAMVNKLLKVINSGYYAMPTPIKSIGQAITMLGSKQLAAWMTLMLMSTVDKPHELTTIALQRAKMCEGFARAKGFSHTETYFLVGLLSVLDALMDKSMDELVSDMPVSPDVIDALLTHSGAYGQILETVIAYEQGNWDHVLKLKLSSETIRSVYLDAIGTAARTMKEMYTVQNK